MIHKFLRKYYRLKISLWSLLKLPKRLLIADTNFSVSSRQWPVAVLCRTETTEIKSGRMFYEPNEHPYFLDLLSGKPGVFFDVGSHCGYYSLIAASKGFKVVAFEIMDELAKATKKNFQENSINGQVVKTAIGKGGEDIFFGDALSEKKLKAISLDDYAKSTGLYPDVIKMDIEGSELAALQGAHEVLSRKPALDISIHPHYLKDKGQSEKEVLDLLSDYGYKIICDFGDTYFMR